MYNRILVPLDGSELSECSLEHVKEVAIGCHVPEVTLLAVVEPLPESMPPFWGAVAGAQSQTEAKRNETITAVVDFKQMTGEQQEEQFEKRMQVLANDYLCRIADRLNKEGINVKTEVRCGRAADAIIDFAAENGIDLIVMSTHQQSDNRGWDIGKVTDKVIRSTSIPVLTAVPAGCRI